MKRAYTKPLLAKRGKLGQVTALNPEDCIMSGIDYCEVK